ncbi:ABC transporter permease [Bacteroidota bacterium]
MNKKHAPSFVRWCIKLFCRYDHADSMIHSIEEEYSEIMQRKGELSADLWFWFQTLRSLPRLTKSFIQLGGIMLANYFKIAFRNIKKHKGFSFINIAGLAIGVACSILIFLYVNYEFSYDKFHLNADRIYRYASRIQIGDVKINSIRSSSATFKKVLEDFPEIETGVKIMRTGTTPLSLDSKTFLANDILAVDSTFFDVFTFNMIHGYPKTALTEPNTIVITEETALKYFGEIDVVGKQLSAKFYSDEHPVALIITGVTETVPVNSHFYYDILISSESFPSIINNTIWDANNFISYYLLKPGVSHNLLNDKLKEFTRKYLMGEEKYDQWVAEGNYWDNFLQPLTSIHLNSDMRGEFEANGNENYVYMFLIISIIILLIACINFMNLSTAKSSLRAKEVALRKVVGSDKKKLIIQFLSESVILSFVSLALGILIVELLLPVFRNFIGRPIELNYFDNPLVIPVLIGLGIFVGIFSGLYPAFILSSFKPVSVMKSKTGNNKHGSSLRNILIITQFSISVFLIIGTLIVFQQLKHIQNIKLGFEKEQVLVVHNVNNLDNNLDAFKEKIKGLTGIIGVSGSSTLPGRGFGNTGFKEVGSDNRINLNIGICDYNYANVLNLELVEGRFFSEEYITDNSAVILNSRAVELSGWGNPIGKRISHSLISENPFTVIGVVKDYYYESLHQEVKPMALFLTDGMFSWFQQNYISIRFTSENLSSIITNLESNWNSLASGIPFEYSFLDEDYDNLYIKEQLIGQLFTIFSLLTIFIACLGLYGLASFVAERKTKEIGIRKVLGASILNIFINLVKQFTKWVLAANIIAWPLAYYVMSKWLEDFAYRIDMGILTFVLAGAIALVIAFITVSYQSIKAACANPIKSIQYE